MKDQSNVCYETSGIEVSGRGLENRLYRQNLLVVKFIRIGSPSRRGRQEIMGSSQLMRIRGRENVLISTNTFRNGFLFFALVSIEARIRLTH
jgi:hypothetical protein